MSIYGGTIRIKQRDWDLLTKLAVNVSVQMQKPINQATVLHAIMNEKMPEIKTAEATEMVKRWVDR